MFERSDRGSMSPEEGRAPAPPRRAPEAWPSADHESESQRNNRNLADLLQELRVAGLGVQMLFGFLLALPFTVRFSSITGGERDLYRASFICAALSTALLVSPVAYHRWVFRRHEKGRLLRIANVQALFGLLTVALAVTSAVWLVLLVVGLNWIIGLFAALTTCSFAALWFGLPLFDRLTSHADGPESGPVENLPRSPTSARAPRKITDDRDGGRRQAVDAAASP